MKKTRFVVRTISVFFILSTLNSQLSTLSAQESYTYTLERTRTIPIVWRPDSISVQRYTVAVRPYRLLKNGLQFDFEMELPRPGDWIQTSLAVYIAPADRVVGKNYNDDYFSNSRWGPVSGFEDYHDMWGLGTSALYKRTFHPRGWYYSAGISLEFFRVGSVDWGFADYTEDGLTFWKRERELTRKSYLKPTVQINFGKHMALSRRCFFDLYVGVGLSHSWYKRDYNAEGQYYYRDIYDGLGGFAYRGLLVTGGFRFGVLLWTPKRGQGQ